MDLIALGVGSTLGAGVYVLSGEVAQSKTGPAIILSFLAAALSSILAGLCYAEFGARVPKAGSAYTYSYVTLGELWAFVIGWNLILEYVIGAASLARAWSANLDTIFGGALKRWSMEHISISLPGITDYPDFIAFLVISIFTVVLCVGVKESAKVTKVLTGVNIFVIAFVIVGGLWNLNFDNWFLDDEDIEKHMKDICVVNNNNSAISNVTESNEMCDREFYGSGGFAPHGFTGIVKGAAVCFFGYVGFDIIASTGEEAKNPQKSVPISIVVSLLIVFVAYFGISCVLTLMVPYYMLDTTAPLPKAFEYAGWGWAVYLLGIGGTCALSSSLMGAIFPLPRIVYAMAQDGLLFGKLGEVSARYQTPIIATVSSGLLAGVMVLIFDLSSLVDMMSIGTLLAYTLVAACVLILRYQPNDESEGSSKNLFYAFYAPCGGPTEFSGQLVYTCTLLFCVASFVLGSLLSKGAVFGEIRYPLIGGCVFFLLFLTFVIYRQPQNNTRFSFMVPALPLLPLVSCFFNIYLMCELDTPTWYRFLVWMAIGFAIYFGYGYTHSTAKTCKQNEQQKATEIPKELPQSAV